MRLQSYFALSLCLLVASLGCSSHSGNAQPPASGQTAAGQTPPTTTTGATATAQQTASPQMPGVAALPGQPPTASGNATTTNAAPPATNGASPATATDACALLTSDEIKSVQGEAVQEARPNRRSDSSFAISQCFYMTPSFTKSVSIEVTRPGTSNQSVREFWKSNFERAEEKREKKNARREKQGRPLAGEPAQPLKGIGDEAYWINTNANSTLYAFKKEAMLRISIGGVDKEDARLKKIKTLAQKALARL